MNVIDFLEKNNSTDIRKDSKMIEDICSIKTRMRLERYVKNLTRTTSLKLSISLGNGCYAKNGGENSIHINIDPLMMYKPDTTFEEMYLMMQGAASHEAGHILYSDYKSFGMIHKEATIAKAMVPKIARKVDKASTSFNKELYDTIFKHIYSSKMIEMVNSLEDGAVENLVSKDFPRTYGGLVCMRNHVYEIEKELIDRTGIGKFDTIEEINMLITEIRSLCTIAYRKQVNIKHLEAYLKKDDVEMIRWYTLYARLGAKNTMERIAMSNACMEYLKPLFEIKAKEFYEQYMNALSMDAVDLANSMQSMLKPPHSELSINSHVDSTITPPKQHINSDFSFDLPQDIQEKINNKIKEQQEKMEKESTSGESSSQNGTNYTNQNQNDTEQSANKEESNTSSEGKDSKGGSNQNKEENKGNTESKSAKNNTDIAAAAAEAESALQDSINKLEAERKIEKAHNFKSEITGCKNGKAPELNQELADPSVLSNIHKNVRTLYHDPSEFGSFSYEGNEAYKYQNELEDIGKKFSKKMKEILMYMDKNKVKNGLLQGKIKASSLYRAKTDGRAFQKKTIGITNKARFCVLIDQSGSMGGQKMMDAIKGAYLMLDACQRISVPISILGHNTRSNSCNLYHYVDYKNYKSKEYKEKIFSASSGSANHDGLAIFHSLIDLVRHRQKNEKLIMLVISDGAPAGIGGYYGEVAYKDIQSIYKKFETEFGVKTIGIGIGYDTESVQEIYENYILVPNVEELPGELLKILKETLTK